MILTGKNYEQISILKNSFIKNFSDYKEVKKVIIEFKKKEKNLLLIKHEVFHYH
jgi:hypothetical protein